MAQPQEKLVEDLGPKPSREVRHRLDEMDPAGIAKHLTMFQPTESHAAELMDRARQSVPGLTADSEIQKVLRYSPDCIMAVARKNRFDPAAPAGEGLIAFLPLNMLGLQH